MGDKNLNTSITTPIKNNDFLLQNQNYFFLIYTCDSTKEIVKILSIDGEKKNLIYTFSFFKNFILSSSLNPSLKNDVLNSLYEIGAHWILDREKETLEKLKNSNSLQNQITNIRKELNNIKFNLEDVKNLKKPFNFLNEKSYFYTLKKILKNNNIILK